MISFLEEAPRRDATAVSWEKYYFMGLAIDSPINRCSPGCPATSALVSHVTIRDTTWQRAKKETEGGKHYYTNVTNGSLVLGVAGRVIFLPL